MKTRDAFTVTLGLFFLIEGIWGLFNPMVFGLFSTNTFHTMIHLGLGVIGIGAGRARRGQDYLFFVGIVLLAVGVLWFLPEANEIVVRLFNVNRAVASLNIVLGITSLILARPTVAPVDPTDPTTHSSQHH